MFIAHIDERGTEHVSGLGSGVTAEQAAAAMGLAPGTWREISDAEAVALLAPTLEEVRAAALEKLKAKRLAVEYAGPLVEVDGRAVRFPSEIKDETRLNSLALKFTKNPGLTEIPYWKVADGVYVTMTPALVKTVQDSGFDHINATFYVEAVKRMEIEACADAAAVEAWLAANLETGWPA